MAIKAKKRKAYTVSELRILAKEFELMRDSLYHQGLIEPRDYGTFTSTLNALNAARVKLGIEQNKDQLELF